MKTTTCLFCNDPAHQVPIQRWNMRCAECKKIQTKKDEEEQRLSIQSRDPAAIIHPDGTEKTEVFVDKFGKETKNPGYNLKEDPRGWKFTGTQPHPAVMILR